ncbi:MAG: ABC transporter ATP-binding protein [Alphaproteobacteria bacterium]|nr:ABC transporter ATP-binding protein [Alphaproteobacteria bacterium]
MADETPSTTALLRRLLPYVRYDAPLYIVALLAAPIGTALVVVQPWLLKTAIDDHIQKNDAEGLITLAWAYLVAVVLGFVAEAVYNLALSYGAMRTISRVRRAVYRHTLTLARSYFDRVPTGRLLTRVTSDIEALGETLTAGAITIILDVLLVLGIIAAMLWLDPWLTAVMLVLSPVLAVVVDGIRRVLRKLYQEVRTSLASLNAYMAERITGLGVVQLYRDEARVTAAFDERLAIFRDATIKTNFWDALLFAIVDGLSSICMALMLWYGSGGLFGEAVTAGLLAAFIEYVGRLFQPIREFSQKLAVIQRAAAALEKIFGLLDEDEHIAWGDATLADDVESLVVDDLSFAYGDGPDVLQGVSLTLRPGQVVALVGRTGSGKSTLGKLLQRSYQGYRGSIRLNGVELRDLRPETLHRFVGVVQQDVQLFPGSVRFNLTLGADIPDAVLEESLDLCRATDSVIRLGGLDGRIRHEGANVSVGEGQLLSFARTLAARTPIVVLDEATASVDSLTEARIQAATDAILARRTVLVIAHRLSTIMDADEILVLDAGRVIERGTHADLVLAGGPYAALFESQFHDHESA